MTMACALANPHLEPTNFYNSNRLLGTDNKSTKSHYDLPTWKVGKHLIHAKNSKNALKYIKKRGLWDGESLPILIK